MEKHVKPSILKSLILSLFIHFFILQIFIFTIPVKKIPFKPKLIFFGSVLDSVNIIQRPTSNENEAYLPKTTHIETTKNPLFDFQIKKPKINSYPNPLKQSIKSNFLKNVEPNIDNRFNLPKLEELQNSKPYQPLELKNNDSY